MKKIIVTGCNGQLGREINRFYNGRDDIDLPWEHTDKAESLKRQVGI